MISIDYSGIVLRLRKEDGKTTVFDPVRKKWIVLTPEEHVRQYMIQYMITVLNYSPALMAVEKNIKVGDMNKRFDIVAYGRDHKPWLLAECKAPDVEISEKTLQQLLNYQRRVQCNYWLLTNGHQVYCANASDINNIMWLTSLPVYEP